MTTIRRIPTSKIDGNDSNATDTNEIRPYGEIAVYINTDDDQDNKLELLIFDGERTHLKSKVLSKGTFYGGDGDSGDGEGLDTIKLIPDAELYRDDSNYDNDQYIIIDPTGGDPNHIHIRAGGTIDQSRTDLFLGGENNNVRVSDTNDRVTINTDAGEGLRNWIFDNSGNLTLPAGGDIRDSEGNSVLGGADTGNWTFDSNTLSEGGAGDAVIEASDYAGAKLILQTRGLSNKQWAFDQDGAVTFPDATVQTTAYPGPQNILNGDNISIGRIDAGEVDIYGDVEFNNGTTAFQSGNTVSFNGPVNFTNATVTGLAVESTNIARNIESESDVSIRVNLTDSTQRVWQFGEDGELTLPNSQQIRATDANILEIGTDLAKLQLNEFKQSAFLMAKKSFSRLFNGVTEVDGEFSYDPEHTFAVTGDSEITVSFAENQGMLLLRLLDRLETKLGGSEDFPWDYTNIRIVINEETENELVANIDTVLRADNNYGNIPIEFEINIDEDLTAYSAPIETIRILYDYNNTVGFDVDEDRFGMSTDYDDIDIYSGRDIDLIANDDITLRANSVLDIHLVRNDGQDDDNGILLITRDEDYNNENTWKFQFDGDLTLPAGGDIVDSDGVGQLANRVEGSWTVTAGTNTYSFTVPSDGTYVMWVKGNIPNGIITWNATLSVSNSNVPAIGTQYAWNYTGGGTPISLTSIPDQIKGVAGTISTDATYEGTTSNRFDFGISNTSGESQTVYYGYTKI
jgi:hypothetical protein